MRLFRYPRDIELATPARSYRTPRRVRVGLVFSMIIMALVAAYGGTVVAFSVDSILFPGNELSFGNVTLGVPSIGPLDLDVEVEIPIESIPVVGSAGGRSQFEYEKPNNVLVMGTDHTIDFAAEADPGRTDTLFVVEIDPNTKTATILNFPRDSWIDVPSFDGGWTTDRINTAYERGVRIAGNDDDQGPPAVIATLKHNFGIDIDYWIMVDWRGFTRIVDSVGGIAVKVEEDMYDPISTVLAPFGGTLSRGYHVFNGEQALAYSRYRADSDLRRIERQHQVIFALMDRIDIDTVLSDPLDLWDQYRESIRTNINAIQVPGLALLARQIGKERITAYSLGPAATDFVSPGGAAVLLLDPRIASKIIDQAMPASIHGGLSIQVVNAAGEPGWATKTRDLLVAGGAPALFVTASDEMVDPTSQTVVLNYSGDRELALRVARWLRIPEDRVIDASTAPDQFPEVKPGADIVVISGGDLPFD